MWKCLKCGTGNEWNFCTECRSSKEENEPKDVTPQEGLWKCSRCGTEIDGNFCVSCGMAKLENNSLKPVPEEVVAKQPVTEGEVTEQSVPEGEVAEQSVPEGEVAEQPVLEKVVADQPVAKEISSEEVKLDETVVVPQGTMLEQPIPQGITPEPQVVNSNERSGKKGCVIAIIVALIIVSLIGGLIFAAFSMIFGARESEERIEVIIEEDIEDEEYPEGEEVEVIEPFDLHFWHGGDTVYIENEHVFVIIPLPPNARMENVDIEGSSFLLSQEEGDSWFGIRVILREQMVDEFWVYSEYEVERTIYWHNEVANVIGHDTYDNGEGTLVITYWEDDFGDGITFTLIRPFGGFILLTELGFDTLENKEDFFEVYGFNENFYGIIQDTIAERKADMAASDPGDGNDRGEDVEWTSAQRTSWWDLMDEFWEAADPSFDLFFYIWDVVILDDTVLDDYPNADVARLRELHEEFDNRFEELIGLEAEVDFTLPYEHENNRNAFRDMRDLITEHEGFYREFRAALEGR